jgi:hypothetical protein
MIGYKLRETIWRALKTRGKAIRSALDRYNHIAPSMNPPAPLLEWKQLMDYTFVSEFELLKHSHSHQDITREPWAIPSNREMTTKYFKIVRAREEIVRVNIEVRRLHTSIRDEHIMYEQNITRLQESSPLLAAEIQNQYATRRRINTTHILRIGAIEALPGFSGICGPGIRCGASVNEIETMVPTFVGGSPDERAYISDAERAGTGMADGEVDDEVDGDLGHVGDDLDEQIIGLTDVIANDLQPSVNDVPESMMFSWSM